MEFFIGNKIEKKSIEVKIDDLKQNEFMLIYVGAGWSCPCRNMLQTLKIFYEEVKDLRVELEIIYVSCDRNEEEFNESVENMPWCYVPYKEHGIREIVTKHYDVAGIPTLLLVNEKGYCVSNTCVATIATKTVDEAITSWREISGEVFKYFA